MATYDLLCPVHGGHLVSVSEKPRYLAKCVWKECGFGVAANDVCSGIKNYYLEAVLSRFNSWARHFCERRITDRGLRDGRSCREKHSSRKGILAWRDGGSERPPKTQN